MLTDEYILLSTFYKYIDRYLQCRLGRHTYIRVCECLLYVCVFMWQAVGCTRQLVEGLAGQNIKMKSLPRLFYRISIINRSI